GGDDARVGGIDPVDVGVDIAALGLERGGQRHGGGVGAAAAERGDAVVGRDALEAGDDGDLADVHAADQFGAVDVLDACLAVRGVGLDGDLPALPGARLHPPLLQRDRQQAGGDLLAGRHHGVVFARVVQRRQLLAPGDELVGGAGHGGDHDGDLVSRVDLALDAVGHGADAGQVGDRGAAEFHHDAHAVVSGYQSSVVSGRVWVVILVWQTGGN